MKTTASYRDWVTFFSITLPNDVRESIIAEECGILGPLDELLSFFASLAHDTDNDAEMPEALASAFSRIANHLGDSHGLDLPERATITSEQADSISRVMLALMPDIQLIIAMDARSAYPSVN